MDLLNTIRARGLEPNEITYNVVMGACGAAGRWKEALDLFYEMQGAGLPPDAVTFGEAAERTRAAAGGAAGHAVVSASARRFSSVLELLTRSPVPVVVTLQAR